MVNNQPGGFFVRWVAFRWVTFGGGRPETSEHWSFFCVEKSFWAGGLAPRRGHGYALEEYAIRRRRRMATCVIDHYWKFVPSVRKIRQYFTNFGKTISNNDLEASHY